LLIFVSRSTHGQQSSFRPFRLSSLPCVILLCQPVLCCSLLRRGCFSVATRSHLATSLAVPLRAICIASAGYSFKNKTYLSALWCVVVFVCIACCLTLKKYICSPSCFSEPHWVPKYFLNRCSATKYTPFLPRFLFPSLPHPFLPGSFPPNAPKSQVSVRRSCPRLVDTTHFTYRHRHPRFCPYPRKLVSQQRLCQAPRRGFSEAEYRD